MAYKEYSHTKLIFQNTIGLDIGSYAHSLRELSSNISNWYIDVPCLVETHNHWRDKRVNDMHCTFLSTKYKRVSTITLKTWNSVYK